MLPGVSWLIYIFTHKYLGSNQPPTRIIVHSSAYRYAALNLSAVYPTLYADPEPGAISARRQLFVELGEFGRFGGFSVTDASRESFGKRTSVSASVTN
jgi:hypothetical protein